MPVDRDEAEWGDLQIVFCNHTRAMYAANPALSDFTNVRSNGKIAMKLPEGVELVNARICSEDDDVMLTTNSGRAIRFASTDLRVMKLSRLNRCARYSSHWRRYGRLHVRLFAILKPHPEERAPAYLKMRRALAGVTDEEGRCICDRAGNSARSHRHFTKLIYKNFFIYIGVYIPIRQNHPHSPTRTRTLLPIALT